MKLINKMTAAAVLALTSAGVASAQTYHVTGSTAYRGTDVAAEVALCGGTSATAIYWGSSLSGSNYSVIKGNGFVFENFFNGSIAGDEALIGKIKLNFPSGATYTGTNVTTAAVAPSTSVAGGTANSAPSPWPGTVVTDSAAPDIAFSDVSFDTAQQIINKTSFATTATPANDDVVGIVPFVFIIAGSSDVTDLGTFNAATDTYSNILSMDPQKFTYTWGSVGSTTLSFFTGVNADEATTVYPLGRDVDSGTRASALAETGYGLTGSGLITGGVFQYYPYDTAAHETADQGATLANGFSATTGVCGVDSGATTIGVVGEVPNESIDGYTMTEGDGGYYTGSTLAAGITTPFASTVKNTVLVAYVGASDAKTALTAAHPAMLMAYNGVTWLPNYNSNATTTQEAANAAKIYEGQYTFWSYEHEFSNSNATTVAGSLETFIVPGGHADGLDELSSNGIEEGDMNVGRSDDGQNVQ